MTSVEQFFYGQQVETFPFSVEFLGICIYRVTYKNFEGLNKMDF